jgi:putative ABC transport system permease protein
VGGTARDPWQRTFDAANGAHVIATAPSEAAVRRIGALPGVAERDRAVPSAVTTMTTAAGHTERLELAGLPPLVRVDAPVRTDGSGPREGGIVLERSLAEALDLRVGTTLGFASTRARIELPVVGTAISPSRPRYPRHNPGVAWVTRAALERIAPDRERWAWTQAVRLSDPSTAPAFAEKAAASFASLPPGSVLVRTWEDQREEALHDAEPIRIILTTYTIVLLVVVFALSMKATLDARTPGEVSDVPDELPVLVYTLDAVLLVITTTTLVAIALLSVRERIRDYGVLKTIGLTPRQIASSLVGAHAAVALIAALLSIPAGIGLYRGVYAIGGGSSEDLVIAPWGWLALVPIATLLVVAGATGLPARLATRIPTADALRYQ